MTSAPVCIGLDIGTSGTKAVAVSPDGSVVASESEDYGILTPRPGWTEQEPESWWQASCNVLRTISGKLDTEIAAIGLTGQMHGSVFLDADGAVIRPALLWNDQRTANQCAAIEERVGSDRLRQIAGNPALTGFQAPKILWLREEEPESHDRVRHVLLPKDFIRQRLTGGFATDASDAAGTLLLDLGKRDWSEEILGALDIAVGWLPEVFEGPEVTGTISDEGAQATGLAPGVPVVAGGGDNAAAAVGCGVVRKGAGFASLGTSGVVFVHSDRLAIDPSGALHAFCHAVPGCYHLMGVVLSAGGALRWYRDAVRPEQAHASAEIGDAYDAFVADAAAVAPGADGLLFLPYLAGERTPHMDPDARAAWVGLTLAHDRKHMVRAVLEGVGYALTDSVRLMRTLGVAPDLLYAIGGGARSDVWRSIVAAQLETPLQRLAVEEGPAMGAALLAMVGAGVHADVGSAVDAAVRTSGPVEHPDADLAEVYRTDYERYRRLYPALRNAR